MNKLEVMFGYALSQSTNLSTARAALGYTMNDLGEAVQFRFNVCDLSRGGALPGRGYITDYNESIREGVRVLSEAN